MKFSSRPAVVTVTGVGLCGGRNLGSAYTLPSTHTIILYPSCVVFSYVSYVFCLVVYGSIVLSESPDLPVFLFSVVSVLYL